ncbi:hypothetical protein ECDEC5B_2688 [Escherichia coli DEC5B]|nr:hypothetical protein ECDEC5B_2688 [Escherichia coli DEC5B]
MDFMLTVSGVFILSIAYTADKYGCHLVITYWRLLFVDADFLVAFFLSKLY